MTVRLESLRACETALPKKLAKEVFLVPFLGVESNRIRVSRTLASLLCDQLFDVNVGKRHCRRRQLAEDRQMLIQFHLVQVLQQHFPAEDDSRLKTVHLIRLEVA